MVEDQIEAGTQPIPTLLELRDAGVAAADLEGDDARRKRFLQLVDPVSKPQHLTRESRSLRGAFGQRTSTKRSSMSREFRIFSLPRPRSFHRVTLLRDATKVRQMTRADLTEEVHQAIETPRKESDVVVCAIFDSIVRALRSGDKVEIRGFGSFHTRQRRARIGRNPKTGARVEVPPKRIPFFKPSKELRELVDRVNVNA